MKLRSWKTACIAFACLSLVLTLLLFLLVWGHQDSFVIHDSADEILTELEGTDIGTLVLLKKAPDSLPDGWLHCEGQELKRAEYRALLAIIGYRLGRGSENRDTFFLPDYRGLTYFDFQADAMPWWGNILMSSSFARTQSYSRFVSGGFIMLISSVDNPAFEIAELMWVVKAR